MSASSVKRKNPDKHRAYRNDFGHLTKDYLLLKRAIQRPIDQSTLNEYKARGRKERVGRKDDRAEGRKGMTTNQITDGLNTRSSTSSEWNTPAPTN